MRAFIRVIALVLCIAVVFPMCAYAQDDTLRLITPPSRTNFYEGKDWGYVGSKIYPYANFDLSGTVLEYEDTQIPFYIFPWGANMWCEPVSGSWETGENDIDIFIDDVDGVSTRSSINLCSISKITVAEMPSKTTYIRGIDWDYTSEGKIEVNSIKLDGLKLNILYSDGTTDIVTYNKKTQNVSWTITSDTFRFQVGKNTLYAVYSGKKAKFSINIELEKITKAYVKTPPEKSAYVYGTDWKYVRGKVVPTIDLTGFVAGANCNNGDVKYISYAEEPERFKVVESQNYQRGHNYSKIMFDSEFEITIDFVTEAYGDVDIDGFINATDALLILKYVVGTSVLEEKQQMYADVNDDGRITSADALSVLSRSVGLTGLFEAEI